MRAAAQMPVCCRLSAVARRFGLPLASSDRKDRQTDTFESSKRTLEVEKEGEGKKHKEVGRNRRTSSKQDFPKGSSQGGQMTAEKTTTSG